MRHLMLVTALGLALVLAAREEHYAAVLLGGTALYVYVAWGRSLAAARRRRDRPRPVVYRHLQEGDPAGDDDPALRAVSTRRRATDSAAARWRDDGQDPRGASRWDSRQWTAGETPMFEDTRALTPASCSASEAAGGRDGGDHGGGSADSDSGCGGSSDSPSSSSD